MKEKDEKIKRLSQILKGNTFSDSAFNSYRDHLEKKRSWKLIEEKMGQYKKKGWPKDKLKKFFQWERLAHSMYNQSLEKSMSLIKNMASEITDEQFEDLKTWINKSSYSREAWERNVIKFDDSLHLIRAKVVHLAYVCKSKTPVNIGEIIRNQE
jgi:hypothetical protein